MNKKKTDCPYCGRTSALRKDGTYRLHVRSYFNGVGSGGTCEASERIASPRFDARASAFNPHLAASRALSRARRDLGYTRDRLAALERDMPGLERAEAQAAEALAAWDAAHPEVT